jgi:hypothetical protein
MGRRCGATWPHSTHLGPPCYRPGVLDGLFVTPAVTAIAAALGPRPDGAVAVVGNAKLAAGLAATVCEVIAVGMSARAAKKLANVQPDVGALADRSVAAVVGSDLASLPDDAWPDQLRAWTRAVRDGGTIVMVDRGHAPEASRRALCAGLSEIEQRRVGRVVVTSGLVTHL